MPQTLSPAQTRTRNFCIIAHIDHGKSTLADRMLELTATLSRREMREQVLDSMDLERERGITIKAHPVHMRHQVDGVEYALNLIDTPGHVDFSYEVSRSLAACEGAVLLVDATQGIEAQTLANAYAALELDLTIIPVVNKTDLPTARTEEVARELTDFLGADPSEVIRVSAKTGDGVRGLLDRIVAETPTAPRQPQRPPPRPRLRLRLRPAPGRRRLRSRGRRPAPARRPPPARPGRHPS